ncbi:PQQ-binding-like beta-propeller repeat protein [Gimesia sp.]|uniref:outer membrane protein assembly factor BamB family protein n=1 Tax=Gimesia sp. TaxID=2024833 RepID=UPI003A8DA85A
MLSMGAHLKHFNLKSAWTQCIVWSGVCFLFCQQDQAEAQQVIMLNGAVVVQDAMAANSTSPHKMPGFSISVDEKKLNLLEDYERYIRHRMWEKALASLKELSETKSTSRLLPTKDGFLVDAEDRVFQALTALPPEGREAFRLFFDGKAQKQFEELTVSGRLATPQAVAEARKIFSQYFLTSIGDDVADLLGNDAFEQGEFQQAARYWRAVLDHHPDSNLSEIDLNVKYALALIRNRQTDQAAATIQLISQQYSDQKVTLGGNSVDPVLYLKNLLPAESEKSINNSDATTVFSNRISEPLKMSAKQIQPRWQVTYLDQTAEQAIVNSQSDYYGRAKSYQTFVPPMTVDDQRAYFNFYGICFAVDLQTGKLVWRNAKFKDLGTNFNNYSFHQSSNLKQYHISVEGDYVLATLIPQKEMNRYRAAYRLIAYQRDSGKQLWIYSQATESFISKPLVDGEHIYVVSHKQNNKLLTLNCLQLKTGKKEWSIPLGSVVAGNSSNGMTIMPIPILQKTGDSLLILTNNGALFEISIPAKTITWAFRYPYKVDQSNTNYYYAALDEAVQLHSEGQMLRDQNQVYFKEAGMDEVYALDLAAKKLLWKRPIKKSAQLVGIDQQNVYLLSRELEAIDRKSHELNWAVKLPVAAGGMSALVDPDQLWVFTSRGIFEISKTNGDILEIYRGHDLTSLGGSIDFRQGLVLCVSNQAVTAYPVTDPGSPVDSTDQKSKPKKQ